MHSLSSFRMRQAAIPNILHQVVPIRAAPVTTRSQPGPDMPQMPQDERGPTLIITSLTVPLSTQPMTFPSWAKFITGSETRGTHRAAQAVPLMSRNTTSSAMTKPLRSGRRPVPTKMQQVVPLPAVPATGRAELIPAIPRMRPRRRSPSLTNKSPKRARVAQSRWASECVTMRDRARCTKPCHSKHRKR